jgi:RNA polymerase sigma factor (sigma-70 family)
MKSNARRETEATLPRTAKVTMQLRQFIEDNAESLTGILRSYVTKAGLASDDEIPEAAQDLFGEVIVEALKSADRFDPSSRPTRAWLLKIASNLVMRRQSERCKRRERESSVRDHNISFRNSTPGDQASESRSDSEFFDQIATQIMANGIRPNNQTEWARPFFDPQILEGMIGEENAAGLLALVSAQDREVLKLAVIHELDGKAVAQVLKIKPGAARKRLHVALNNLRAAVIRRDNIKGEK